MSICTSCGLCCDGTLFRTAALRPEEVDGLERQGLRIQRRSTGTVNLVLPCVALEGSRCGVYEERPATCRAYHCSVLRRVDAGDMAESDALALIAATRDLRDRVTPALNRFLGEDEQRALDEVYRSLLRQFEPSSSLAARITPHVAEAGGDVTVNDVLPMRDLAYRDPVAAAPDPLGRSPFAAPVLAVDLAQHRLDDLTDMLGPEHRDVLAARDAAATWTGLSGRPLDALAAHQSLLVDRMRLLGPDDPDTLASRHEVADWTGICGEPADALARHRALLPDRARVLGADHPNTLNTRHSIAYWTGVCEGPDEALACYGALLADRLRVLGPSDPDTFATRAAVAHWTGVRGDVEEALLLAGDLLFDRISALGANHPDSVASGRAVAHWSRVASASR